MPTNLLVMAVTAALILAAAVLLLVELQAERARRRRRLAPGKPLRKEEPGRGEMDELIATMSELITEFKSVSDLIIVRIEAKTRELHRLIKEADQRIQELRRAGGLPDVPGDREQRVSRLQARGLSVEEIARETGLDRQEVERILRAQSPG